MIYAVDANFRLLRCNPAWDKFALDNNGSRVKRGKVEGLNVFAVIPHPLFAFYSKGFETAKRSGEWQHVFEY